MQELQPNIVVDTADLIYLIASAQKEYQIEGVTFLGGEPFLQAEGCATVAAWCQLHGLSVLAFSGFLYNELQKMNDVSVNEFLANIDVLVDGPFEEKLYDRQRDWVGSTNQKIWYLSNRYDSSIEQNDIGRQAEIFISDSSILMNGWPF